MLPIHFHSREIMNGITAFLNQSKNSVQPPRPSRDFQGHSGREPKRDNPGDIGKVKFLKILIVGDIEKNVSGQTLKFWHARTSFSRKPCEPPQ